MNAAGIDVTDDEYIADEYLSMMLIVRRTRIYLIIILCISVFTLLCTVLLSSYVSLPPKMLNIVTDGRGHTERIYPVINPQVTDEQAILWANDSTTDLLSLHFKKYNEQIANRKRLFVGGGWDLYRQSLIDNKVVESVVEKGLVITAGNAETPKLLRKSIVNGKMNWYLEIPIFQTVVGAADGSITTKKIVGITVEATRRDEALEGLKIRLFNIKK